MSSGGGLLDLVARGKKDTFFTQNPKVAFINSVYPRYPAFTQEIRLTQPYNRPEWGRWVDFELEPVGDILRNPVLLIEMPTWLPPPIAKVNSSIYVTDLSGVEYGYTQDLAAAMIDKVQVFNDQYLVHEFWGQWLEWRVAMQPSAPIHGAIGGRHPPLKGYIAKAATPRPMRLHLPLLGNQFPDDMGIPMVALTGGRLRIRVHLKKLEEIIEASDGRLNPKPWDQPFQYLTKATSISGEAVPFQTLPRNKIQGPTITLETTQIYIPRDAREYLRKTVVSIPYIQVQLSKFTVEDFKWYPIVNTGAIVSMPLPLDFVGAVSRITVGVITDASLQAGQAYQTNPPSGGANAFLQNIRLNVGTLDRINRYSVQTLRDTNNYYKNQREPHDPNGGVFNVYTLTFGSSENSRPVGTFNMSRTLGAILYVDLDAISADPRTQSRKAYIYVFGEAWNVFEIRDGRPKVLFAD